MLDLANLPVPHADGSFISERVSRIVEVIRDYDSTLDVRWIPPNQRGAEDPAFAIVCSPVGAPEYVVFYIKDEAAMDGGVLQRIYEMDAAKHGNILTKIESENKAVRAIQANLHKERLAEAADLSYSILRSKKHVYKHDGIRYE